MTYKMTAASTPFNPSVKFPTPVDSGRTTLTVTPEVALGETLPHNQQLVRFIMQHQPISAADLFTRYSDAGPSMALFRKRLTYLKSKQWVCKEGEGLSALYTFNTKRPASPVPVRAVAPAPKPAPDLANLAHPRRSNVMAGTYQPAPEAIRSLGSDDFTRLPSLRQGRCVPFVPGYIFY